MSGYFAEEMFDNYSVVILRDDAFEGFLGKRCGGKKYGVCNGLGKFLGHDDIGLAIFFMRYLSHRRD